MKNLILLAFIFSVFIVRAQSPQPVIVMQTDFGLKDGAVSAMKGVATGVSPDLRIYDLTHEIPPYNVWEGAYRLFQTVPYWPKGTVFVSVVDPGVGTERKSVVALTRTGHFIVTPDNGTLTLLADEIGIAAVSEIDEALNRRRDSRESYTFHGRDVYAYTAARLASGLINFEGVGKQLPDTVVRLPYQQAVYDQGKIYGTIPILDIQYGNVWTNIGNDLLLRAGLKYGDRLKVTISNGKKTVYTGSVPFLKTFGEAPEGTPLVYLNSLMQLSIALNMASFAEKFGIGSGNTWKVVIAN
ncbi:S-adenosyl-l-methionine hydroxide adenosyltransferase family protein [Pedobacter sp. SYP-B3415]|uniref:SAM hydrolase/SAM-dependent halogenase family protein n=1 Tax=Pedobacter sp. SYP-B3415 TaxID=2496641 RepID=UPI00101C49C8|nr:S-adenosyl-l-methionine hydroxide adenosyltransferase family protein [Pedobacter sp. SYP-B3415]